MNIQTFGRWYFPSSRKEDFEKSAFSESQGFFFFEKESTCPPPREVNVLTALTKLRLNHNNNNNLGYLHVCNLDGMCQS